MKKLCLSILIVLFVFSVSFVTSYSQLIPNPGHGADKIFIFINGGNSGLQSAIDSGQFSTTYSGGSSYSDNYDFGHETENIFVRVGGEDKTFQGAIDDGSLCSSYGGGSGSYSGNVPIGHKGEDVLVNFGGEKTLQQAINEGKFGAEWSPATSTVCSGDTFTQTRCGDSQIAYGTKNCAYCGDNICNNGETCSTCPGDCGSCYVAPTPYCGDNICNNGETCSTCPGDCGYCAPVSCSGVYSVIFYGYETKWPGACPISWATAKSSYCVNSNQNLASATCYGANLVVNCAFTGTIDSSGRCCDSIMCDGNVQSQQVV